MRINELSKTDFDRAKIKLTGHFDRRPTGRYFEPWLADSLPGHYLLADRVSPDIVFLGLLDT